MKRALIGLLLLTTALTTACGWQLRGALNVDGLESLHVSARNLRSDFVKELKYSLDNQGVEIVDSTTDAQYSMVVLTERSDRRVASVGSSARAAEYLLIEEVEFLVLDKTGQELLPATSLRSERSLAFDENQVIGKTDEANLIRKELRRDLVRQVTSRLQHLTTSPASAPTPAASDEG